MGRLIYFILFIGVLTIHHVIGQENAQSRIPRSLQVCYQNRSLYERDNRLPMTINTLIELIKKIEETPNLNINLQDLASTILHRFKQDGIERIPGVEASDFVIPYGPQGFQFYKHRLLLTKLLPVNNQRFPNDTLSIEEQCTLHFMLSNSIDKEVRGDEPQRCGQLAQLRANRIPRSKDDDVELMEDFNNPKNTKASRLQIETDDDYEDGEIPIPEVHRTVDFGFETANNVVSQCPVENGVIRTKWGTVNAGTLLAGIATGLLPQAVRVQDIMPKTRNNVNVRKGDQKARQTGARVVDNRYAATLAGDLSEVALLQGPKQSSQVGANGAWNSTATPRWYFLSQREKLEMTDAEIRGGLDGLIIAKKIIDWRTSVNSLKLYQILDMYYSQRGVFSGEEKACNRKVLFSKHAPETELKAQTIAFSSILDNDLSSATFDESALVKFSTDAADSLIKYIPQSLNDVSCEATMKSTNDNSVMRTLSDLFIFVDTTWQYVEIFSVISDIFENMDIGHGTNVTLMNAQTGDIIVNSTSDRYSFYTQWTANVHQQHQGGLSLSKVVDKLKVVSANLLDAEKNSPKFVSRSQIALIIPNTAGVSDAERNYVLEQLETLRDEAPDLKLLFLAGGTASRFAQFVQRQEKDLFNLNIMSGIGNDVQTQTKPVIERIQEIPRRITNKKCGSRWDNNEIGNQNIPQFIEPNGLVHYRLHPNYFHRRQDNRKIKIQGSGYGRLTICHSRKEYPRENSTTNSDVNCKNVMTDTVEIDMSNTCGGQDLIHQCDPLYISVEYRNDNPTTNYRCNEDGCRSPDSARFVISTEQLGCYSSATNIFNSLKFIFAVFVSLMGILFSSR